MCCGSSPWPQWDLEPQGLLASRCGRGVTVGHPLWTPQSVPEGTPSAMPPLVAPCEPPHPA
eukprot:3977874-Ditylum_brightwellii.AAC.1